MMHEITLPLLGHLALYTATAVFFMIVGVVLRRALDGSLLHRAPRDPGDDQDGGGGGGWPDDVPDPDDSGPAVDGPAGPAGWIPAPRESPLEASRWPLEASRWPLESADPPRRGRHRLRTGAVYYRPVGVY